MFRDEGLHHHTAREHETEESTMNAATPSILVVDDEVDFCSNLSDILADIGYRVDTAHEGGVRPHAEHITSQPLVSKLADSRSRGTSFPPQRRHSVRFPSA